MSVWKAVEAYSPFFASLFLSPWRWGRLEIWALFKCHALTVASSLCSLWKCFLSVLMSTTDDKILSSSSVSSGCVYSVTHLFLFFFVQAYARTHMLTQGLWCFMLSMKQAPLRNPWPKSRPSELQRLHLMHTLMFWAVNQQHDKKKKKRKERTYFFARCVSSWQTEKLLVACFNADIKSQGLKERNKTPTLQTFIISSYSGQHEQVMFTFSVLLHEHILIFYWVY